MNDAEITAQAHFLLGARQFLEQMMESVAGASDEGASDLDHGQVVDAYLSLVRDGLGRRSPSEEAAHAERSTETRGDR